MESHEKRLRDRYAVVSALAAACFTPSDAEHIGSHSLESSKRPLPFEWYGASPLKKCHSNQAYTKHYDQVLVMWTTDSMLGSQPSESLRKVLSSLMGEYWKDSCFPRHALNCFSQLAIKLIGPLDSPTLRMMLESAGKVDVAQPATYLLGQPNAPKAIELYSPWATADPELLLKNVAGCDDETSQELALEKCLEKAGIVLAHAIISDRELTQALVRELLRRQVALEKDKIVLISEWDTFYGRALPIAFEKSVEALTAGKSHKNISRYSYLRGLDGLTHEDGRKNDQHDAKKAKNNSLQEATVRAQALQELERPDGESQLGYLRRLAAKIRRDANRDGKPVKAIGVLGSDIYDTKLILKALRDEFSGVWFFTTTLDARLLEEGDYPWTRNLIIASPFGLELHQQLQGEIPPFRDSYQTSTFFSVLRAVGRLQGLSVPSGGNAVCKEMGENQPMQSSSYFADDPVEGRVFSARLCPRLFEIGRRGPVDISVDRASLDLVGEELSLQPVRRLLPQGMKKWWNGPEATEPLGVTGTVISLGMALASFLLVFTRSLGRGTNYIEELATEFNVSTTHIRCIVGAGILGVLVGLTGMWGYVRDRTLWEGWEGEPISMLDGVSVWPSVAIRAMVICWCIGCILFSWTFLRLNQAKLRATYKLTKPRTAPFWKQLHHSMGWVLALPKTGVRRPVNEIYHEYQRAGSMWCRLVRVTIFTVFYGFVLFIVSAALSDGPPFHPCRGDFSCWFSQTVLYAAVLAMLSLNMFVFDAVLLCQGFVLRMQEVAPESWPVISDQPQESEQNNKIQYLSSTLTVRFVADHTAALHRLVFFPFIALFFMIASRNRYFDSWDFPTGLIVVWVCYAFIALTSILRLRTAACQVRDSVLASLRELVFHVEREQKGQDSSPGQLSRLIEELQQIQKGAYAPLFRHPALGTSLIAVVALLQYWVFGR